jgi:hypothetical protein
MRFADDRKGKRSQLPPWPSARKYIANQFHVLLALLKTQANRANLQAAESQHMSKAINPRPERTRGCEKYDLRFEHFVHCLIAVNIIHILC